MRILAILIFSLSLFISPSFARAETAYQNVGLIENTIWYSKDPFLEGDAIKVYALLYNSSATPVSGTVEFYDGKVVLGKKDVTIPAGSSKDVFISWEVTAGEHSISVKFLDTFIMVDGKKQSITVDNISGKSNIFVPKKILSESKEIVPVAAQSSNNSGGGDVVVDKIVGALAPYTPEPIKATAMAIDDYREQKNSDFLASKNETSKEIAELKSVESEEKDNPVLPLADSSDSLKKPLAYVSLFFWGVLVFIFSHKIIFYGLILVIVVFFVRFIWMQFRK